MPKNNSESNNGNGNNVSSENGSSKRKTPAVTVERNCEITEEQRKNYEEARKKYEAENKQTVGTTNYVESYTDGQFVYYKGVRTYKAYGSMGIIDKTTLSENEWSVQLKDPDSTDAITTQLCTSIDGQPVVDMSYMFWQSKAKSVDLSSFNTKNIRFMRGMFADSAFTELNVGGFDTSNVVDMIGMFNNTAVKDLDLSSFDFTKAFGNIDDVYGESRMMETFNEGMNDCVMNENNNGIGGCFYHPVLAKDADGNYIGGEVSLDLRSLVTESDDEIEKILYALMTRKMLKAGSNNSKIILNKVYDPKSYIVDNGGIESINVPEGTKYKKVIETVYGFQRTVDIEFAE